MFDNQFNKAIKTGVDKGDFTQPKGMFSDIFVSIITAHPRRMSVIIVA